MDNELAKALNIDLNDPKEQLYLALHRKNSERKYLLLDIRKLHRADEPINALTIIKLPPL